MSAHLAELQNQRRHVPPQLVINVDRRRRRRGSFRPLRSLWGWGLGVEGSGRRRAKGESKQQTFVMQQPRHRDRRPRLTSSAFFAASTTSLKVWTVVFRLLSRTWHSSEFLLTLALSSFKANSQAGKYDFLGD